MNGQIRPLIEVSLLNSTRWLLLPLLVSAVTPLARAQATSGTPETKFQRFISDFDLGVTAMPQFIRSVSGTTNYPTAFQPQKMNQSASTTVGVLGTIRYTRKPYLGFEFNYAFSRYSQKFDFPAYDANPDPTIYTPSFQAQNSANEYSLGYVAHPQRSFFGLRPYIGGGAGSIEFKPTKNGGDNLPQKARATYYYTVGGDAPIFANFGVRVGFRQSFYKAPDFGQNYLTIDKLTFASQPTIGFYLKF